MKKLLVALLVLAGCKPPEQPRATGAHRQKPRVAVTDVGAEEVVYTIETAGSIEAVEEISLPARVSGIVDAINFKEGDVVETTTVLAEIEVEKFRLGEERAKAELDRARAQANLAETVFKNRQALYEEGLRQKKEWVTEEQMATWRADVDKAKADLDRARVDLELARRSHADARVRPPFKGIINQKLVSRGEFVKPETVIATMINVGTLHLRFTATELEAARLRIGQEIGFAVRGAPGRRFTARLFHMSQKADPVTRSVECKAEITNPDAALRAGYFAAVQAVTGAQRSIVVPERAVLPGERGFTVFVAQSNRVHPRTVTLGLRVDGKIEITHGLKAGETIVADGAAGLREGMEVEPVPAVGNGVPKKEVGP